MSEFEINLKGSFYEAQREETGVLTIISSPKIEQVSGYIPAFVGKGANIYFTNEGEPIPKD